MGDFQKSKGPAPKYPDPGPLGGSFIVNCLKGKEELLQTGKFRIPHQDDLDRASDLEAQAKQLEEKSTQLTLIDLDMGEPSAAALKASARRLRSARARRPDLRAALKSVCEELRELVEDSLDNETAEDWSAFWVQRIDEYIALFQAIGRLKDRLCDDGAKVEDDTLLVSLVDDLSVAFPEAGGELDFLTNIVDRAARRAATFATEKVSDQNRDKDFECAGRFQFWGAHFNMCIFTLDLAAGGLVELKPSILEQIFVTARNAALQFNHATMEAAELRAADVERDEEDVRLPDDDDMESTEVAITRFEADRA